MKNTTKSIFNRKLNYILIASLLGLYIVFCILYLLSGHADYLHNTFLQGFVKWTSSGFMDVILYPGMIVGAIAWFYLGIGGAVFLLTGIWLLVCILLRRHYLRKLREKAT